MPLILPRVRFCVKEKLLKHLGRCRDAGLRLRYLIIINLLNGRGAFDNEGLVRRSNDLRVPFLSVIPDLADGNKVPVTVRRGGRRVELPLPVSTRDRRLVRDYQGEQPSYFIYGPLVFSPAKQDAVALGAVKT